MWLREILMSSIYVHLLFRVPSEFKACQGDRTRRTTINTRGCKEEFKARRGDGATKNSKLIEETVQRSQNRINKVPRLVNEEDDHVST